MTELYFVPATVSRFLSIQLQPLFNVYCFAINNSLHAYVSYAPCKL